MKARLIDVGKRFGRVSTEQRFINRALVEAARTGGPVVRLKGGDPLVFGRAQEEIDALRAAGIEVVVVPGVTAALAAGTLDDLARQAPALHGGPAILALGAVFAGARGEALALPIDRRALPA